ncbi:MAG: hypothetical protein NWE88_11875 [Candidatus Bathyarchaeota archaeon]|nr:hypothetical protein [Candidatus Bathyarchaeota archaeon]
MSEKERRLKILGYAFAAVVVISSGLIMVNFTDYVGLLNSMSKITFSIDEMVHSPEGNEIDIALTFSVDNPTAYTRLKFSSLQCQLYLITDGGEEYIGATAYAPPVDVPLKPFEGISYTTSLSVSRSQTGLFSMDPLDPELEWRVRSVIHFSTPIRKYYQTVNFYPVSNIS